MALSSLIGWNKKNASSACASSCGSGGKPSACGASKKSACGSSCGSGGKPSACGASK